MRNIEKIREALGEASFLFMSQEVKGTQIIMPTEELERIAQKLSVELMDLTLNFKAEAEDEKSILKQKKTSKEIGKILQQATNNHVRDPSYVDVKDRMVVKSDFDNEIYTPDQPIHKMSNLKPNLSEEEWNERGVFFDLDSNLKLVNTARQLTLLEASEKYEKERN